MAGSGLANLRQIQELRNELNQVSTLVDQATNNVTYLIGTGDPEVDAAAFDAAVSAITDDTPWWIDFGNSTAALKRHHIAANKRVSIRNGRLLFTEPQRNPVNDGWYYYNWSAGYAGGITWGTPSSSAAGGVDAVPPDSPWNSYSPGADLPIGSVKITLAALATAVNNLRAVYADDDVLDVYVDLYSATQNPYDSNAYYAQRVKIANVDGNDVYFSEPTIVEIKNNGNYWRLAPFHWVCQVKNLKVSCTTDTLDTDRRSINMMPAFAFNATKFDVSEVHVEDMGLYRSNSSPGTCHNCSGISRAWERYEDIPDPVSGANVTFTNGSPSTIVINSGGTFGSFPTGATVTITGTSNNNTTKVIASSPASTSTTLYVDGSLTNETAASATVQDAGLNSYGAWGIYATGFIADHFVRDVELTGYRHAIDPANVRGTQVNHVYERVTAKGCYQAAFNSHQGGRMTLLNCSVHLGEKCRLRDAAASEQGNAVIVRGQGAIIDGLRVIQDGRQAVVPIAVNITAGDTQITNCDITTAGRAVSITGTASATMNCIIRDCLFTHTRGVLINNGTAYLNDEAEVPGAQAVYVGDYSTVDIDNCKFKDFAVGVQQASTSTTAKCGPNLIGQGLLTESTTSTKHGNVGALLHRVAAVYDERAKSPCLVSQGYTASGARGLVVSLQSFPDLDTSSFTICFWASLAKRQRTYQYFLATVATNKIEWGLFDTEANLKLYTAGALRCTYAINSSWLTDGIERHYCFTLNNSGSGTAQMYVNGATAGSPSATLTTTDYTHTEAYLFRSAVNSVTAQAFGTMRDFRVYSSALSSGDVAKVYANTYTTAPTFWLPCDEGQGKYVRDVISKVPQPFAAPYATTDGGYWGTI